MKTKPTAKIKIIATVLALTAALAISVSAVYGWFLTNRENNLGDVDLDVIGSANVALTAVITDQNGVDTGSFRFTDAVPGSRFKVTATMRNATEEARTVMIVISDLVEAVRPYRITEAGEFLRDETRRYQTVTMRNAFAVSETNADGTIAKRYFDELGVVRFSGDGEGLVLIEEIDVPAKDPENEGSGIATIEFYVEFMDRIMKQDGNALVEIKEDAIVDDDGGTPTEKIKVDINIFQGQYFKIGRLELIEKLNNA